MAQGDGDALALAIWINIVLLVAFTIVFFGVRRVDRLSWVFYPRQKLRGEDTDKYRKENIFRWIYRMVKAQDVEMEDAMGLDAVMFLRSIRLGIQLLLGACFFCIFIVLPVNITGDGVKEALEKASRGPATSLAVTSNTSWPEEDLYRRVNLSELVPPPDTWGFPENESEYALVCGLVMYEGVGEDDGKNATSYGNYDKVTLSNIEEESPRFWAHLLAVWGVSLWTFYLLNTYYRRYREDRIRYRYKPSAGAENYTLLVTDIPLQKLCSGDSKGHFSRTVSYADGAPATAGESSNAVNTTEKDALKGPIMEGMRREDTLSSGGGAVAMDHSVSRSSFGSHSDSPGASGRFVRHRDRASHAAKSIGKKALTKFAPVTFAVSLEGADPDAIFNRYFRALYGPSVLYTSVVPHFGKLMGHVAAYNAADRRLESATWQMERSKGSKAGMRPRHKKMLLWGEEVDTIDHFTNKREKVRQEAEADLKTEFMRKVSPSGFVGFKTRAAAAIAAQVLMNQDPHLLRTEMAPPPGDIIWDHLKLNWSDRATRIKITNAIMAAIVLFYMVPITFVSAFTTLENLEERLKFIRPLTSNPQVRSFLVGFLPGLALMILMSVLPIICLWLGILEGHVSYSRAETSAFQKFFIFIVVNVWFGSTISQSVLQSLDDMINNPSKIHIFLATSIPSSANLFMNFVLVKTPVIIIELLNLPQLFMFLIKKHFLCSTERDFKEAWAPAQLEYHRVMPMEIMIIMLGIIYCNINPIILPLCIVRLAVGYLVWTNQVLRTYDDPFDNGGRIWPLMHVRILVSLAIWQVTMIGLFVLKLKIVTAILTLPLLAGTFLFHLWSRSRYKSNDDVLPLDVAITLDRQGLPKDLEDTIIDAYWPNPLKQTNLAVLRSKRQVTKFLSTSGSSVVLLSPKRTMSHIGELPSMPNGFGEAAGPSGVTGEPNLSRTPSAYYEAVSPLTMAATGFATPLATGYHTPVGNEGGMSRRGSEGSSDGVVRAPHADAPAGAEHSVGVEGSGVGGSSAGPEDSAGGSFDLYPARSAEEVRLTVNEPKS